MPYICINIEKTSVTFAVCTYNCYHCTKKIKYKCYEFYISQRKEILGKKKERDWSLILKFSFLVLHIVVWIFSAYYFGGFSSPWWSLTVSFRHSTISEAVSEPLVQLDFPSFIKSIIDKPEGDQLSLGKCDFFFGKIVRMKPHYRGHMWNVFGYQ